MPSRTEVTASLQNQSSHREKQRQLTSRPFHLSKAVFRYLTCTLLVAVKLTICNTDANT